MRLSELFNGICHTTANDMTAEITSLTSDSRKAVPGVLFCAIKGLTRDGHDFAKQASEAGAVVLVARDMGVEGQIIVEDTREAFAAVCENFCGNPLKKLKLVGVTGTNGKTSTTYILKHVLENCGYKCGLIGTIQNMIGDEAVETHFTTPDTLELHQLFARMAEAGCEYCIMEVSSFALDQGRVAGLHFVTTCFTNLTQDHLDTHGTMEAYFAAKCKLFDMCDAAVINDDDPWAQKIVLPEGVRRIGFSETRDDDIRAHDLVCRADGVSFGLSLEGGEYAVKAGIPGRFTVYNLMTVVGLAYSLGVEPDNIIKALETAKGVKGRAEVYPTGEDFTIVIDYAHSPDGVVNILTSMGEVKEGRLVALLGCGGDRDAAKRPLMGEAAAKYADFVIVTSDNPRSEDPAEIIRQILPGVQKHDTPYTVIENRREAMEYAVRNARKGDLIVLAGKGHETYQILSTGTIHFDEREVLDEIFAEIRAEGRENVWKR